MANPIPTEPKENILMPEVEMRSASLFHSVSRIPVVIDTDLAHKEIYPQGSVKIGDNWVQTFALTGAGIAKLITAAGIAVQKDGDYRTDDRSHPHICSWHWTGEWRQPDGTLLVLAGDYTSDLRDWINTPDGRIRGPQFEKIWAGKMETLMYKVAEAQKKKTPRSKDERMEFFNELFLSLSEAERKNLEERAERSALQSLIDMRPHVTTKAQTGAMLRAVRKLLQLKATYTMEELKRPFVVYRSSFRFEEMAKALGPEETHRVVLAAAANYLGLSAGALKELPSASMDANESAMPSGKAEDIPEYTGDEQPITTEAPASEKMAEQPAAPVVEQPPSSAETPPASKQVIEQPPNELYHPIPWRGNEVVLITETIDLIKDKALIDRAPRFIKPKAHLANHLKSHYQVERWSQMTLEQGLILWAHLDELEFADGAVE